MFSHVWFSLKVFDNLWHSLNLFDLIWFEYMWFDLYTCDDSMPERKHLIILILNMGLIVIMIIFIIIITIHNPPLLVVRAALQKDDTRWKETSYHPQYGFDHDNNYHDIWTTTLLPGCDHDNSYHDIHHHNTPSSLWVWEPLCKRMTRDGRKPWYGYSAFVILIINLIIILIIIVIIIYIIFRIFTVFIIPSTITLHDDRSCGDWQFEKDYEDDDNYESMRHVIATDMKATWYFGDVFLSCSLKIHFCWYF